MLSGQLAWGRLWGAAAGTIRSTPIALFAREDAEAWQALATPGDVWSLAGDGRIVHEVLAARGACFPQELEKATRLLPAQLEGALSQLVGLGLATCDGFGGLRELFGKRRQRSRRRVVQPAPVGRWSLFRTVLADDAPDAAFVARQLLQRTGVVFRRTLDREQLPVPWWQLLRALRTMEARGEVRGGRFVAGFSGEQYALPEAVSLLRKLRREQGDGAARGELLVDACDPLNYVGILTPDERVATNSRRRVQVA